MVGARQRILVAPGTRWSICVGAALAAALGAYSAPILASDDPPREAGLAREPDEVSQRESFRVGLRRSARFRIRDFGRVVPLGIERANHLLDAALLAAGKTAAEAEAGSFEPADRVLFARLWSHPAWLEAASEHLDDAERAAFQACEQRRLDACERASSQLAVAELCLLFQLRSETRLALLELAAARRGGAPEESPAERYLRALEWARGEVGDLDSARLHRFMIGHPDLRGEKGVEAVSAEARLALHEVDLEIWVAEVAELGALSEEERVLLFDCGRRAILVSRVDPKGTAEPLDDPILAKALTTIAGGKIALQMAVERRAREAALRVSRESWFVAELDRFLWLTEIQTGALRLVFPAADGLPPLDPRLLLADSIAALPVTISNGIMALLEPFKRRLLEFEPAAMDEEPR